MDLNEVDLFFDAHGEVDVSRRNLPHWKQEGKLYFVTWRLADSLSQEALGELEADRAIWIRRHGNKPISGSDQRLKYEWHKLFDQRVQHWLDAGYGACWLRRPEARRIMVDSLHHFHGQRYQLGSFAVAANHVHVLVAPFAGVDLSRVLHSWKSFTANAINKAMGRTGRFWMDENFDRIVRGHVHLERIEEYIARHADQGAYVERRDLPGGS